MGGSGSGRHWQFGKDTTDSFVALDIRRLKRDGLLSPGQSYGWQWSRSGVAFASIRIATKPDQVILKYRHRSGGEDWKSESYPVWLTSTPCHLGGNRDWFLCPASGCHRRAAILYGGGIFACRQCYQLVYSSQRERGYDRAARRADRIRERLGWPYGILDGGGWGKPKGMHWKTYRRLEREHDVAANAAIAGIMQRFDVSDWV